MIGTNIRVKLNEELWETLKGVYNTFILDGGNSHSYFLTVNELSYTEYDKEDLVEVVVKETKLNKEVYTITILNKGRKLTETQLKTIEPDDELNLDTVIDRVDSYILNGIKEYEEGEEGEEDKFKKVIKYRKELNRKFLKTK